MYLVLLTGDFQKEENRNCFHKENQDEIRGNILTADIYFLHNEAKRPVFVQQLTKQNLKRNLTFVQIIIV